MMQKCIGCISDQKKKKKKCVLLWLSLIFLELCYFPIVYFCHPAAMKEMHVFCDNDMK